MRQMTGSSNQYGRSGRLTKKRRRRKLHRLELIAIVLGVFTVGGVAAFIALVFSSGGLFHNFNQPQPPYAIAYIEQNDDDAMNNYNDTNINDINEEVFVGEVDTDEEYGHEAEDRGNGNSANEIYVSVEIDELTENYASDYSDAEQTPQEVQYEQNNTEYETIESEIQDTVTEINDEELDTNITIRFISEIGLTYDIYIPALAPDDEVRYIMLHHTYGLFETDGSLRGMHNDHRNRAALDGGGIAYSEIIQKDGTVWIARGALRPSHTGVSLEIRTHSYSITVTGNFDRAGAIMSDAQFNALASRIAAAMRQFPNATIVGHSDLAATACPGRNFPWDRLYESIGAERGVPRGVSAQQ